MVSIYFQLSNITVRVIRDKRTKGQKNLMLDPGHSIVCNIEEDEEEVAKEAQKKWLVI